MKNKELFFLLLIGSIFFPSHSFSQGMFPSLNFHPDEYNAPAQNFALIQDDNRKLYVGNKDGVLIYDGEEWRIVKVKNGTNVLSLKKFDNKIYVGASKEFGYLKPSRKGKLKYVSLLNKLSSDSAMGDFNNIHVINNDTIVFQSEKGLYFLNEGEMKKKMFPFKIVFSYSNKNNLFLQNKKGKLFKVDINKKELAYEKIYDPEIRNISQIRDLKIKNDSVLTLLTSYKGIMKMTYNEDTSIIHKSEFKQLNKELINDFDNVGLTDFAILNKYIVIGSQGGGLLIFDKNSQKKWSLNSNNKLLNDFVNYIYIGENGEIWTALNKGIARIGLNSPLRRFSKEQGINGTVQSVLKT
ncbi:MAG: hypothetical protein ABEH43_03305, partial [Flavobacteriales bacterium]